MIDAYILGIIESSHTRRIKEVIINLNSPQEPPEIIDQNDSSSEEEDEDDQLKSDPQEKPEKPEESDIEILKEPPTIFKTLFKREPTPTITPNKSMPDSTNRQPESTPNEDIDQTEQMLMPMQNKDDDSLEEVSGEVWNKNKGSTNPTIMSRPRFIPR